MLDNLLNSSGLNLHGYFLLFARLYLRIFHILAVHFILRARSTTAAKGREREREEERQRFSLSAFLSSFLVLSLSFSLLFSTSCLASWVSGEDEEDKSNNKKARRHQQAISLTADIDINIEQSRFLLQTKENFLAICRLLSVVQQT
jgi:hypothetical protein